MSTSKLSTSRGGTIHLPGLLNPCICFPVQPSRSRQNFVDPWTLGSKIRVCVLRTLYLVTRLWDIFNPPTVSFEFEIIVESDLSEKKVFEFNVPEKATGPDDGMYG